MTQSPKDAGRYWGRSLNDLIRDLLAIFFLWALVIAFFWQIALAGRVLAGGDVFTYFYPYWAEATRAMQAVRLPLWNPYLFMGVPFLANSQVGFFYPLNWPLWLSLPAHQSVHLTIVLHLCLAALNGYLWGRVSLRMGRTGAWTVGAIFALGGYLGAQVEHVNQLQGLAWLPLMLTLYDKCASGQVHKWAGLSVVVGLVLLAGHTQTAFISLVGLAVYGLTPALWHVMRHREWKPLARRVLILAAAAGWGVTLAAVQLVPTWELARLSVRAGGLPFNDRVSFSLSPFYLARALLPGFAETIPPEHIEHVAYIGIAGLALAAIAIASRKSRAASLKSVTLLIFLGLFFSLGFYNPFYLLLARYVPGFAHFRVPARWLILYVLGMAALAGWGADVLWNRCGRAGRRTILTFTVALALLAGWAMMGVRIGAGGHVGWPTVAAWAVGIVLALGLLALTGRAPRLAAAGLLILLVVELFGAGRSLPYNRATAPQAFTSLRPAIAHLLAAGENREGGPRFLSMSDITFDPGDMPEIEIIYGPQLPADARYDYIVAAKHKEILGPDLPLAFEIPAVDGYDGGVLPLARYVTLQRLFLPEDKVSIDGRLRENLDTVPPGRWLSLFDTRYVITDKVFDGWIDGIFYDLQFGARLAAGEEATVAYVPPFAGTALGLVSYLDGAAALPDGTPVGEVSLTFSDGTERTFVIRAGVETAEGLYGPDVAHTSAPLGGHFWPGEPRGNDYAARLSWGDAAVPVTVTVRAALPQGRLVVRGLSLVDERSGSFQSLLISDQGRFRLVHSGDVKVYENLDVLPRAFVVHRALAAQSAADALVLMQEPEFDPARTVVVEGAEATEHAPSGADEVRLLSYEPERVEVEVSLSADGYLVLSDAAYPGWQAWVDGAEVEIVTADLLFRAVRVDAGRHRVVFRFQPRSLLWGEVVSAAALLFLTLVVWRGWRQS